MSGGDGIGEAEILAEGYVDDDGKPSVKLTLTASGEKIAAIQTRHLDEMNDWRAALTIAFFEVAMQTSSLAAFQGKIPPELWAEAQDAVDRRFSRAHSRAFSVRTRD